MLFVVCVVLNSLNSTLLLSDISRDSPVSFSLPEMLSSWLAIFSFPDGKNNKVKPHHLCVFFFQASSSQWFIYW